MDFDLSVLPTVWPALRAGLQTTVLLTFAVIVIATPAGVGVAMLARSASRPVRGGVALASWALRGVPPLLVLFLFFFGLPSIGITLPPLPSAVLAMSLYMAFYLGEVFRAGLASVPAAQWQAASALGLSRARTLGRIVLPQAMPAALPSYVSQMTEVLKGTALASAVAVPELMSASRKMFAVTYRPFEVLLLAAILYAVCDGMLLLLQAAGERWAARRGLGNRGVAR